MRIHDESLDLYLKEIREYPLLSREEEINLSREIKEGSREALEKLSRGNLRFVVSIAKYYMNRGVILTDLIQEGNLGLMRACNRYDETRGTRFISYAVWWIRQAIYDILARQGKFLKVPSLENSNWCKISKSSSRLEQNLGRELTEEDIMEYSGLSKEKFEKMRNLQEDPLSLEDDLFGDGEKLLEFLSKEEPSPEDIAYENISYMVLEEYLDMISEKEAMIIKYYFGVGEEKKTLEEIGEIFGFTRERARQIKERGLDRLRNISRSNRGERLREAIRSY